MSMTPISWRARSRRNVGGARSSAQASGSSEQDRGAPVLFVDGTCHLCRASGRIACRLAPGVRVQDDNEAVAKGPGVVLSSAGQLFVGLDAVVEWLRLAGGVAQLASRLLATRLVSPFARRAYGWVAKHRHLAGRARR